MIIEGSLEMLLNNLYIRLKDRFLSLNPLYSLS